MEYRQFGNTGLKVSAIGFGCGDIGGLIIRGEVHERTEAIRRALEIGITYFDTASLYGRGQSEINLGAALRQLKADPVLGTKVRLQTEELSNIKSGVVRSVEHSLARLGRDHVHLIQLHNSISHSRVKGQSVLTAEDAHEVSEAFKILQAQGKISAWGLTAVGDIDTLQTIIRSGDYQTAQCPYNLQNPSQGSEIPYGYPYQDFKGLINTAASNNMGVIAIRVLAAGALSATTERHELAAQSPQPIGTGASLTDDVAAAKRFSFLCSEGYANDLAEGAIRFAITNQDVSTALIGLSSMEQLECAAVAAAKGPLPGEAIERLQAVWTGMVN